MFSGPIAHLPSLLSVLMKTLSRASATKKTESLLKGFQMSHVYGSSSNDTMAVKGLNLVSVTKVFKLKAKFWPKGLADRDQKQQELLDRISLSSASKICILSISSQTASGQEIDTAFAWRLNNHFQCFCFRRRHSFVFCFF